MNQNPIKVSVIIPVYNAEDFIGECLDCVRHQTLKEIEIICVDDGSTDQSPEILRHYADIDERIHVITQKNAGAGAARNAGLQAAKGEYLSFLDSDDFFETDMLEKAYEASVKESLDIIVFACDLYDNDQKSYRPCMYAIHENLLPDHQPFAGTDVPKDIFKLFVGWAWDKLFRADFVRENALFFQEQRTTNDMLFVFSAVVRAQRIQTLPMVLAHHRRSVVSLSVTREKSWMCFYQALTALREQLENWGLYERFEQDFINYCVHFSLWNLNSLAEPTYTLLYNKLRNEWYESLHVTEHPAEYFYNKHEYREYRKVYENTLEEYRKLTSSKISGPTAVNREKRGALARGIECLKDNGLKYTIKRILKEFQKGSHSRKR